MSARLRFWVPGSLLRSAPEGRAFRGPKTGALASAGVALLLAVEERAFRAPDLHREPKASPLYREVEASFRGMDAFGDRREDSRSRLGPDSRRANSTSGWIRRAFLPRDALPHREISPIACAFPGGAA